MEYLIRRTELMEQGNVCLLIIFNHRYDKNIDVLDRIYRGAIQSNILYRSFL